MAKSRESLLARTLVELADTLVDDYDVVELLTLLTDRCVEVLDVAAAGLMLVAPDGDLRVMASSSETMRLLELFELQAQEGPCLDCYRTGAPVVNQDLAKADGRWPRFAAQALAEGFLSVHALPMRLRGTIVGALNLFRTDKGQMGPTDVAAAQSLADVATIALLQHRAARDTQNLNEQLHYALNSRVVIEQARGMVAERAGVDVDQAFSALRSHAQRLQLGLVELALGIVVGDIAVGTLDPAPSQVPFGRRARPAAGPLARAFAALTEIEPVLDLVEAAAPVDGVEVVVRELAAMVGAEEVTFLMADLGGDSLVRFVRAHQPGERLRGAPEQLETVPLAGTPYQRALVTQQVQVMSDDDGRFRLLAPVSDRGDALGVLEVVLGSHPDDALVAKVASSAHALAYVVIANRRHTDLFESVQRSAPFSLAAEIQRRLLPPALTCEAEQFTLAGWLEPANHVGGDTFDYSLDRDALHASVTDAMGRGVRAALLATLVVGTLRNARRAAVGVVEQANWANEAMSLYAEDDQLVTGLLMRVDLTSGRVVAVNAGHPRPYLLRAGTVRFLELEADIPFGITPGASYTEQEWQLEPGDRMVVVTDGLLERAEAAGHLDVAAALLRTAGLHPREMVHAFKSSVLAASEADLDDDASLLCIDWYGPMPARS